MYILPYEPFFLKKKKEKRKSYILIKVTTGQKMNLHGFFHCKNNRIISLGASWDTRDETESEFHGYSFQEHPFTWWCSLEFEIHRPSDVEKRLVRHIHTPMLPLPFIFPDGGGISFFSDILALLLPFLTEVFQEKIT